MKILTWNCNGAFRKKLDAIALFEADITVIQECEDPNHSSDESYREYCQNGYWVGNNKHKGLGIFASPSIKLEKLDWPCEELEYFIPCRVNDEFNIIACWCHGANNKSHKYIGQLWLYMQLHKAKFGNTIMIGDLNANVFWDKPSRNWNHSDVVRELGELNIQSLYHEFHGESQGAETQPTFYLYKHLDKAYHMDYIFAHEELISESYILEVGKVDEFIRYSDHMPVICDLGEHNK